MGENIDDAFGHWLAGFIDGEGCFSICADKNRPGLRCRFDIVLRADDKAILIDCIRRTRLGYLSSKANGRVATWAIQDKPSCVALVGLLDRFPLRAKKRADFLIWKSAVDAWQTICPGQRVSHVSARLRMMDLRQQLVNSRVFGGKGKRGRKASV